MEKNMENMKKELEKKEIKDKEVKEEEWSLQIQFIFKEK